MRGPAPTLSVIVVTRDRPRLVADALASVARQRLAPLEVRIAVEGEPLPAGAADGLLEVVVVECAAGQPGRARNAAAAGARGEALAFLDDDDLWRPGHLAALAGALADPAVAFVYDDCEVALERVGEDGARTVLARRVIARAWDLEVMRRDDYVPPSTWGVRRALFERLGGFDAAFRYSEDWDFLLRAARESAPRRVPGVGVEVRLRESGNASADFGAERRACLARLAARHGLETPAPKTFWEVAGALGAEVSAAPDGGGVR
uniref:Glycosyltransferase n=1 Tax=Eiseniibacteriota bacterium TaxID=2212470 RepID=A0A832MM25_UNCEI